MVADECKAKWSDLDDEIRQKYEELAAGALVSRGKGVGVCFGGVPEMCCRCACKKGLSGG